MLVTRDPFLAEFDRLTHQFFGGSEGAGMPMDVIRRGEDLVVRIDIPGVPRDAITLDLDQHVLTVSAERHGGYDADTPVLVQERFDGVITRRLRIPEWVDAERVEADYADGVLTVVLPIAEQARPRRIEVNGGSNQDRIASSGQDDNQSALAS